METIKSLNVTEAITNAQRVLHDEASLSETARSTIRTLIYTVTLLTNRLNLNSTNSSVAPSQDPNRIRKKRVYAGAEKRKPGAQPGHEGTTLERVDIPDEIEEIQIDRRKVPRGFYKTIGWETRQVFDIHLSLFVKEYQAEIIENQEGEQYVALFPEGVTQAAQYGNYTKASSVYLSQFQLVPLDRVRGYFEDQGGIAISKGSIANFNVEASEKLDAFEEWAKKALTGAALNHADETGINVGGKRIWLHSLSNDKVTLFHPDEKRGKEAMDRMGILPFFRGVLCHDHWKPYFRYDCIHALCNAHHLRELEWSLEFEKQAWAGQMMLLLTSINNEKIEYGFIVEAHQDLYQQRYQDILTQGESECSIIKQLAGKRGRTKKSKSRNLLERLQDFEQETLLFMHDPTVPFTNNQGENDIRMTKVQQKISGCFRSMDGAKNFCRIRSYISTCQKNGFNPCDALRILFDGKLPTFIV